MWSDRLAEKVQAVVSFYHLHLSIDVETILFWLNKLRSWTASTGENTHETRIRRLSSRGWWKESEEYVHAKSDGGAMRWWLASLSGVCCIVENDISNHGIVTYHRAVRRTKTVQRWSSLARLIMTISANHRIAGKGQLLGNQAHIDCWTWKLPNPIRVLLRRGL